MRFDTTLVQVAMCLASWSSVTAAWPDTLPDANGALAIRQNDNKDEKESSKSVESDKASITNPPSTKSGSEAPKETKSGNDKEDEDKEKDNDEKSSAASRSKSRTASASRTRFPADSPAGGVTMLAPATTAEPTPLYKIGATISFNWNYTSLLGPPGGIDVLASCAEARATWTLTTNMTFKTNASYIWDTKVQATDVEAPLPVELYTLIIKDSGADITDLPSAGFLGVYTGLTFGLYEPAKPTPWDQWKCTGCSAAPSLFERPALGLAVTMSLISVLSFTWFVTGLGLQ